MHLLKSFQMRAEADKWLSRTARQVTLYPHREQKHTMLFVATPWLFGMLALCS